MYQLSAVAQDSTGAAIVGAAIAWSSSDSTRVRVTSGGLVTGVAPGVAAVRASAGASAAYTEAIVVGGLVAFKILADSSVVNPGGMLIFLAQVNDSLGNVVLVRSATWTSSDTSVATVDVFGVVRGRKVGMTVVSATAQPISAAESVTVRPAVASVTIQPDTASVVIGRTLQLTATVRDSSGAVLADRPVGWSTCCGASVVVSSAGLASAAAGGTTGIVARVGAYADTAMIRGRVDAAFTSVAAGYVHTCAVTTAGTPYCWGNGWYGQLGTGANYGRGGPGPTAVAGGLRLESVAAYGNETCGVTPAGATYCWGVDDWGQLGNESGVASCLYGTPCRGTALAAAVPVALRSLALGGGHVCGLTAGGAAWCWGIQGLLGGGLSGWTAYGAPTAVNGGLTFAALAAAEELSCGLTGSGSTFCWGRNLGGEMGLGASDTLWHTAPDSVPAPAFTGLALERYGGCGLAAAGAVYCWGEGTGMYAPTLIPSPVAFTTITGGYDFWCGLTGSGAAYCWGGNSYGQLGNGTTTASATPVAVSGGLQFSVLVAGGYHACGIAADSRLYCWGDDNNGETGNVGAAQSPVGDVIQPVPALVVGQP